MTMNFTEYSEAVIAYLEYLGYPAYVDCFEPEDVAKTITKVMWDFFKREDVSYRFTAICIFGLTMQTQVLRIVKSVTKH